MSDAVQFKINTKEFDRTLREYSNYTKRDAATIVNTKAYYIARRAVAETPMAEKEDITRFIGWQGGEIVGKIVNKGRGKRGEKGLYGKEMKKAVIMVKARRLRSRAFIKSGWVWAVKKLAKYAEKIGQPSMGKGNPKAIGQAKGGANAAMEGFKPKATIFNTVTAAWDTRKGMLEIAEPALERAFEFERQSMLKYIENKLRKSAQSLGIKTK